MKASGKIIRICLQQFDSLNFTKKTEKGRTISGKGHSYLEKKAKEVFLKLKEEEKLRMKKELELKEKNRINNQKKLEEQKKAISQIQAKSG